jgi:hypothetical protein
MSPASWPWTGLWFGKTFTVIVPPSMKRDAFSANGELIMSITSGKSIDGSRHSLFVKLSNKDTRPRVGGQAVAGITD